MKGSPQSFRGWVWGPAFPPNYNPVPLSNQKLLEEKNGINLQGEFVLWWKKAHYLCNVRKSFHISEPQSFFLSAKWVNNINHMASLWKLNTIFVQYWVQYLKYVCATKMAMKMFDLVSEDQVQIWVHRPLAEQFCIRRYHSSESQFSYLSNENDYIATDPIELLGKPMKTSLFGHSM